MPRLALIEDLTKGQVPLGSNLLVEFDPDSQWYNACLSIAAGWLKTEGTLHYTARRPPEDVRRILKGLGLEVEGFERKDKLRIYDGYAVTLGQKSEEKYRFDSLKVSDLSIRVTKMMKESSFEPGGLDIVDNGSLLARFNDERAWIEYLLTRILPTTRRQKGIHLMGVIRGVHSDWAYKQLENEHDGIIDFELKEANEETPNLIRIRNMRNVGFDSRWHRLNVDENFEVTLEK